MREAIAVRPTDGELEILRVLWSQGPSSVGEVHKVQGELRGTSYNTTLKLMQIMLEKGLVERAGERPQIYSAKASEANVQEHLVRDLLRRAFGGSARKLGAALVATDLSAAERAEIRRLLGKKEDAK